MSDWTREMRESDQVSAPGNSPVLDFQPRDLARIRQVPGQQNGIENDHCFSSSERASAETILATRAPVSSPPRRQGICEDSGKLPPPRLLSFTARSKLALELAQLGFQSRDVFFEIG